MSRHTLARGGERSDARVSVYRCVSRVGVDVAVHGVEQLLLAAAAEVDRLPRLQPEPEALRHFRAVDLHRVGARIRV